MGTTMQNGDYLRPPFCFMHIGKVGGHSISQELLSRFDLHDALNASPEQFDDFTLEDFAGKQLIIGHYSYCHTLTFPRRRFSFSMMREPVDRLLSNYWFLRTHPDVQEPRASKMIALAKRWPIEDFIRVDEPEIRQVVDNHQTCFFAHDWRHSELVTANDLALAVDHLDDFDLVGVHASYEESMQVLCTMLDWPSWPTENHLNRTPSRVKTEALSHALRTKLEDANQFDAMLYEDVSRRFAEKRAETLRDAVEDRWPASRVRAMVNGPMADLPMKTTIHGHQKVQGRNWHVRQIVGGSYARWLGPLNQTSLDLRLAPAHQYEIEVHLVGWIDRETLDSLTPCIAGMDVSQTSYHVSDVDRRAAKRWKLTRRTGESIEALIVLYFETVRTGRLVDHGVENDHDLTASVAVSCVIASVMADVEDPDDVHETANGPVDRAATSAISSGVELLHGATGRV